MSKRIFLFMFVPFINVFACTKWQTNTIREIITKPDTNGHPKIPRLI